uniref:Sn-1 protein n=1 Tax=Solanum tuberosum TaxID=4113 RepID=M1C4P5_SOLTU
MNVKGKLIASIGLKSGGHSIHGIFHIKTPHIPNIRPSKILSFEFLEDGKDKIAKQVIDAVDLQKKSITWKVIGGDLLELYNSFTIITSCDKQWTTWTFVYEKKIEETPEPLVLLGFALDLTKDIEGHLLKK